jgi:hypothetical protein
MQSVQESKQELEASIRYAENAISSAKQTIESMEFRQEMAQKNHQEQTGREQALLKKLEVMTDKYDQMKAYADKLLDEKEASSGPCGCQAYRDLEEQPTMPVIPKDVAIAIFREGVQHGVGAACTELEGQEIRVEESEYVGGFEVSFSKPIDLEEELDLDWMRGKCGDYSEESVIDALGNLCADKEFECRIHGIDDQES